MSWKRRKCLKRAYFLPWTNRRQEMQGRFFKNINLNWIMKHFSRKSIFFSWLRMYSSIMVVFNGDTYVLLVLNQTNMYLVCRWPYVWGKVGSIIGNIDKCNTLPSFFGKVWDHFHKKKACKSLLFSTTEVQVTTQLPIILAQRWDGSYPIQWPVSW